MKEGTQRQRQRQRQRLLKDKDKVGSWQRQRQKAKHKTKKPKAKTKSNKTQNPSEYRRIAHGGCLEMRVVYCLSWSIIEIIVIVYAAVQYPVCSSMKQHASVGTIPISIPNCELRIANCRIRHPLGVKRKEKIANRPPINVTRHQLAIHMHLTPHFGFVRYENPSALQQSTVRATAV